MGLLAMARWNNHTLVYVENKGQDSGLLNYSLLQSPLELRVVSATPMWRILVALNRWRGVSPLLTGTTMTPAAEQAVPTARLRRQ